MNKNSKILIVLVVSLVFGILAGVGIYKIAVPERETIYVFNDNYKAGTKITSKMFTPIQVDATIVNAGKRVDIQNRIITTPSYKSLIQAERNLKYDVSEGLPLVASMVSGISGSSLETTMNKTSIAITIPVTNTTGITPDLEQGTYVNVYVSINGETKLDLDLQSMKVLGVYKKDGSLSGVSLECNQTQATKLVNYNNYGAIQLGLVNNDGYEVVTK